MVYSDIELKINYYRERIIAAFIKQGIYPDNKLIQSRLNDIETRLSIFKNPNIKEGSYFDTNEFNEAIKNIYADLCILYTLLYQITVLEYNNLEAYINSHIRELKNTANMYLKRAELESYSTALGQSILFKHSGFDINKDESSTMINLGKLAIADATKVACIANINNVDAADVIFEFIKDDTTVSCTSYAYNNDFVIFPGDMINNEYALTINESQKINSMLELPIVAEDTSVGKFITLAGKDKILYKNANANGDIIEEKPIAINALSFTTHSYIDFYVIGGSSISFRFNKKPIATNFNTNSNRIENLDYIHHFFIECDEGFSFDFELDTGSVYAIKENTIINQDRFYYSGSIDVKEFLLVHSVPKNTEYYEARIKVYNATVSEDDIDSIMIKKIG